MVLSDEEIHLTFWCFFVIIRKVNEIRLTFIFMGGQKMTLFKRLFCRKAKKKDAYESPRFLDPSGLALNAWRTI